MKRSDERASADASENDEGASSPHESINLSAWVFSLVNQVGCLNLTREDSAKLIARVREIEALSLKQHELITEVQEFVRTLEGK